MRNAKTTICGLCAAVAVAWAPFVGQELEWDRIAFAAAVAALGYFAKDGS